MIYKTKKYHFYLKKLNYYESKVKLHFGTSEIATT